MVFISEVEMTSGENGYRTEGLPEAQGLAMFRGFVEENESAKDLKKGGDVSFDKYAMHTRMHTLTCACS